MSPLKLFHFFSSPTCGLRPSGTLEPHLSALLWVAMLVSLGIVIVLPQPHGIRALIAATVLRLIFSVGLQPTLLLLGAFNVSGGLDGWWMDGWVDGWMDGWMD